jgi:hypothetical protein
MGKFKRQTRTIPIGGVDTEVKGIVIPCKLDLVVKTKTSAHNGKPYHVVVMSIPTKKGPAAVVGMTWNTTTKWVEESTYQAWAEIGENNRLENWKLEFPGEDGTSGRTIYLDQLEEEDTEVTVNSLEEEETPFS